MLPGCFSPTAPPGISSVLGDTATLLAYVDAWSCRNCTTWAAFVNCRYHLMLPLPQGALGAGTPTWDRVKGLNFIYCLCNTVRQVKSVRLSYRQEMCEPIGFNGSFDCLCFTIWEDVRAEAKWTTSQVPVFPDWTETKSLEPTALIAVATGGVYLECCHTGIVFETHSGHAWLCLCSRASCMLSYHN